MDFLASLHLEELPEQQTRVAHLSKKLSKDSDLKLGFNCCCNCGNKLAEENFVNCPNCNRVSYCSDACRLEDTQPPVDENECSMGHSSIICSILKLCNDDDDAEQGLQATSASLDRLRTELESYPATLANILREAPCYNDFLASVGPEMIIHVIGASEDAELWNGKQGMLEGYTEALVQLAEDFGICDIQLHMIGPGCPDCCIDEDRTMNFEGDGSRNFNLHLVTHKCQYTSDLITTISKPHAVVFFNPGFTCPDYAWEETMNLLDYGSAILCTTNTELEGVSDCNYLLDHKLFPHLPPLAAEIMGVEGYGNLTFFTENPYAGTRIRQSGTMANDLYIKNRWIIGGIMAKPDKKRAVDNVFVNIKNADEDDSGYKKSKGNTKLTNPSLI
mmetsp:Transcript_15067/g.22980  ORF Transcript_15067/g.22980 Transcript_15067/m.22980 type:complete len:389 (-) Transcript_15067:1070-2236(-)